MTAIWLSTNTDHIIGTLMSLVVLILLVRVIQSNVPGWEEQFIRWRESQKVAKTKNGLDGNYFCPDWGMFGHYTLKDGVVYTEDGAVIPPGVWRCMKINHGVDYSLWTDEQRTAARAAASDYNERMAQEYPDE